MTTVLTDEALEDITCMHIDGTQGDQLLAVQLAQISIDQLDQPTQLVDLHQTAAERCEMLHYAPTAGSALQTTSGRESCMQQG